MQCNNVRCGHTFVAKLEITQTIAPSACPNPEIWLPVTESHLRRSNNPNESCGGREGPPRYDEGGLTACPA